MILNIIIYFKIKEIRIDKLQLGRYYYKTTVIGNSNNETNL